MFIKKLRQFPKISKLRSWNHQVQSLKKLLYSIGPMISVFQWPLGSLVDIIHLLWVSTTSHLKSRLLHFVRPNHEGQLVAVKEVVQCFHQEHVTRAMTVVIDEADRFLWLEFESYRVRNLWSVGGYSQARGSCSSGSDSSKEIWKIKAHS